MTEVWREWEGQVVSGVFPLRRLLSASSHSAVFLTEYKAQEIPDAALKLIQVNPSLAHTQLSYWTRAAALSHPHLIRLLEAGRCRLGNLEYLFVVMEYAEQTLSQILPKRALTSGEVQEMLLPTVSALAFLHRNKLVHGQLKPSNILVVNDQLKLASDTISPAVESTATIVEPSAYDPPEAKEGGFSAAGDIWSLGITMVEALTQRLPPWPDSKSGTAYFAPALPPPLGQIVRQCLNRNPANRPTAADIEAQIKPEQPSPVVSQSSKRRLFVPAIAALLVAVVAVWAGLHRLGSRISSGRIPPTAVLRNPIPPSTSPGAPADRPTPPLANKSPSVLHEVIPDIPRRARGTIHGRIKVAVRVTVDRSGNVVDETIENHGASKYFARLATDAARQWKFAPADGQHKWLLRFEFTRGGATGHAAAPGA